jgi:cytochrome c5
MKIRPLILLILLFAFLLAACGTPASSAAPSTGAGQPSTTVSDGATLLQERCTVCHSSDRITSAHKTADGWKTTVLRMVGKGASLNAQEQQTLIDYLAQTYP